MNTSTLQTSINLTLTAHDGAIRWWDQTTPYAIHPIWSAMTILTETMLSREIRELGYQVLLWHDLLEDTTFELPADTRDEVRRFVQEMTFKDFKDERQNIWDRHDLTKLFKLYDKVSNLLDGVWMDINQWNRYVNYTLQLMNCVATMNSPASYQQLNIVKIAKAICVYQ